MLLRRSQSRDGQTVSLDRRSGSGVRRLFQLRPDDTLRLVLLLHRADLGFAFGLATENARLGAGVVRYSFTAVDLHHLPLAGLPAHCHRNPRLKLPVSPLFIILSGP